MVGLRSSTPRVNFGGPLIKNRLYLLESVQYEMRETPVITLPFPNNEFRREGYNSLTALDYTINSSNIVDGTFHMTDSHTRFANLDFFDPQPVSPTTSDSSYSGNVIEHASIPGNAARQRAFRRQLSRGSVAAGPARHDPDAHRE